MQKLWAVMIGALLFLGWIASGMVDVRGSNSSNMAEISRHEQYVATETDSQVRELEDRLEQRRESLEIIQKNPENYINPEYLVAVFQKDILEIKMRLKEIRGYE